MLRSAVDGLERIHSGKVRETYRVDDERLLLVATFVFAAGVLFASCLHRSLFSAERLSSWLWFAGFGGATIALGAASILPRLGSRRPPR